jgi:dolichol-phosphate mannosyltransferase
MRSHSAEIDKDRVGRFSKWDHRRQLAVPNKYLVGATAALLCLRLVTAFLIELAPQEAYYWNYAIHPALSYFDHPPMVAWVISAGYFLLGKSELGVRIGGFLLTLLSTWLLYALGKLWFNRKAGLWAALLFQLLPLFFVYGVLITPDVPLTFFWLLTLYLFSFAVREDQKWAWYFAGAALGLCLLSKYTGVFLVPSAFLFLILHRRYRPWLLRKEPYLAVVIALIIFVPVILWNIEHDWASFAFQVSDRLIEETSHPIRRLVEFLLIQLGVTSPMLMIGLLLSSAIPFTLSMKDRRMKWRFCFLLSLPLLIFFLFYSTRSSVKANWTLPGYLSLLIAAYPAYRYLRFNSKPRIKLVARYFLLAWFYILPIVYIVAVYHMTVTIPNVTVHHWTTGWRELGRVVGREAVAFEVEGGNKVFILGMHTYHLTAALSFYTDDTHEVFSHNLVGRHAQAFDYWMAKIDPVGLNALAVDFEDPDLEELRKYFTRIDENVRQIPVMKGDRVLYRFYLVKCFGYLGNIS